MEKDFDYKTVPATFAHCFIAQCPHNADCLRFQAALHVHKEKATIAIVNPANVAGNEDKCPYFKEDKLTHFAHGMVRMYNHIPYSTAMDIRNILCNHFERSTYFRIRSGERLIKPSEQEYIRQVFRKKGIMEEPAYDEYIDEYDW